MKRITIITIVAVLALTVSAVAQSSGTLTVSATIASSIGLTFSKDTNGAPVTAGSGNAATLAFGSISAYASCPTGVTCTPGASSFVASTPVDITVTKANSASSNCKLFAQLGTHDAVNTWTVGGVAVTDTSAASINGTFGYGAATSETIAITIPFTNNTGTISNTLNFTTTAN